MKAGKTGAVIAAAGRAERMGAVGKLLTPVGGCTVLDRVMDIFQQCELVDEIVLVLRAEAMEYCQKRKEEKGWAKVSSMCTGGPRRQDSVREGLKRLSACQWVVIHDGARPLLNVDMIARGLIEAREHGAAVAAVPVKDTVKLASVDGFVRETPSRDRVWLVQTPQVFLYDLIWRAHEAISEDSSDDALMVEKLGHKVKLFMGSYENIKITTPEDLAVAEVILRNR